MKLSGLIIVTIMLFNPLSIHSTPSVNQEVTEIKIGGLFPLTGSLALGGIEREAAFQMAIDHINQDAELLNKYHVVGISENTGTDPEIAAPAVERLVQQNVVAFIGASSSSVSANISGGIGKTEKIPQISYSSTSPLLSDTENYPYFTRVVPSDAFQNQALIEIVNEFGWDIVSILRSSNLYGQGVSQIEDERDNVRIGVTSLATTAEQFDIEVTEDLVIENSEMIEDYLNEIKFFGSNIILLNVYLEDAIAIFKAAVELDMTSEEGYVWIGSDAASQKEVLEANELTKNGMQGMIGLKPLQPTGASYSEFLDDWESCNGANETIYPGCGDRDPNIYAPFAYDATYFLAQALNQMIENNEDIYDGDLLLARLLGTQHFGVTGEIRLNDRGDRLMGYDVINVQMDEFVTVGSWEPLIGFTQSQEIYWRGDPEVDENLIPQARLASSWILIVSIIVIPSVIFGIRKLRSIGRET